MIKFYHDAVNLQMVLGGLRPRLDMTTPEFCGLYVRTWCGGFQNAMKREMDARLVLTPIIFGPVS